MFRFLLLCSISLLLTSSNAISQEKIIQNTTHLSEASIPVLVLPNTKAIKIDIIQDQRIDSFYRDFKILQLKYLYKEGGISVYRLQIINTSNRSEANALKKDLENIQDTLAQHAQIIFREPYYKLKAGFFKTKEEAEEMKKRVDRYFNQSQIIVIVPEIINIDEFVTYFYPDKK